MDASLPIWLDRPRTTSLPFTEPASYDVVVVGGGIAGLLTGLLLARGGASVAVLEARRVGDGTTGHTTGKVSALQGTKLSRALRTNPPSVVRDYVQANLEGVAWLRRFCEDHAVPFQVRPAYTYATTRPGELRARAELAAAEQAGLPVSWEEPTELPFTTRGAVRLDDQLQVHALDVLDALVQQFVEHGGRLHEGSRVLDVRRAGDVMEVVTEQATARAHTVVLATNQPILRRHGFFARLRTQRSYAAALRSPWLPEGMYLSADTPTRSLRSLPIAGGELLLVGGNGHVTGRASSERERVEDLLGWAEQTFPGSQPTHVWSAQDQEPLTGLPYVGPMLPGEDRILVVTGFDKWGLSNAPAAALVLTGRILGAGAAAEPPAWARALASWTPRELAGSGRGLLHNGEVAVHLASGWGRRLCTSDNRPPVCTHLGGVLAWNDVEQSWDCPLHGSRFAADGSVLEGPATRPAST